MNLFRIQLAGVTLTVAPRFETTFQCFPRATRLEEGPPSAPVEEASGSVLPGTVSIPDAAWAEFLARGFADTPHMEYSLLTEFCSDALLPYDRIILHGVALRWRDRAWLICAPSGTGKSTQAHWLQQLRPGEFGVICGDRPVLQFEWGEGSAPERITVHPSLWNGKENWHGAQAAPLAGVILLERGEENRLCAISEREAALPFYLNMIHRSSSAENIRRVCAEASWLLGAVPIWRLTTFQVPDSTRLLLESVFS